MSFLTFFASAIIFGVIFVNGWTDAPNAIATCVSTGSLSMRKAVLMSAFFNFVGALFMTIINSTVAMTVIKIADFGNNPQTAALALTTAMLSIIIWAVTASLFGIPTSESHALVAGLTGAAIAVNHGAGCININEWVKVICGLIMSTLPAFSAGWLTSKLIARYTNPSQHEHFFKNAQIFAGAAMSFMHGAQDGQKFMGVLVLGNLLAKGNFISSEINVPLSIIAVSSLVMALGTALGGKKIIKTIGSDMFKPLKYEGFAADLSSSVCLLVSSLLGWPVSTTHVKTSALVGVGYTASCGSINIKIVRNIVWTWLLTFPVCGFLSFLLTAAFLW